jgi:hypothetical protein
MCRGDQGTSMVLYNLLPNKGAHSEKKNPRKIKSGARRLRCPGGRVSSPLFPCPPWDTTPQCQGLPGPHPCAIHPHGNVDKDTIRRNFDGRIFIAVHNWP